MLTKESLKLTRKTLLVLVILTGFIGFLLAGWWLRNLIMLLFIAYLLMLALQTPIRKIVKWTRLPMGAAVFLAYLFFLIVVISLLSLVLPALIRELFNLSKQIDVSAVAPGLSKDLLEFNYSLKELSEIFSKFSASFATILNFIGSTFSTVFLAITLFVISVHLSLDHHNFYKKVYWFTDDEQQVFKVQKFVLFLEKELGGWVTGQVILMLIMGFLVFAGLYLIGVPYALPLGILAGILEIVPNLGPIVAAVPAIILSFFSAQAAQKGIWPGVVTTIFLIVVQQLENVLIVPTVMKNAAHVNPVVSIALIIAGFELFGVVGSLLAVPTYIALRAFYGFWLKEKIITYEKEIF